MTIINVIYELTLYSIKHTYNSHYIYMENAVLNKVGYFLLNHSRFIIINVNCSSVFPISDSDRTCHYLCTDV